MNTVIENVVTGAFGFTGKYITKRLISSGEAVKTLTGHPNRPNPFGDQVAVAPLNFDKADELAVSLRGATTLYNTYWVRFSRGRTTYENAIENTKILLKAAKEAGVRRVVHISITNPSEESSLPYFRGKAIVESAVVGSGLTYAIVRPTEIFGPEDILTNNIAWMLRRFPLIAIPGSGEYRVQPVFVEDVAEIAVDAGHQGENMVLDAVGPETYTFNEMVSLMADVVHSRARIIRLNPSLAFLLSKLVGYLVRDVVLTWAEVQGLMANMLVSADVPTGRTLFSEWLYLNADTMGKRYASELDRHFRQDPTAHRDGNKR